jgi:prepilin-type N-terminal cleavage/methylation domain-containing protein
MIRAAYFRPRLVLRARRSAARRGFSLVEVIVAIALFGITMSALGGLSLAVARQSVAGWGTAQRTAALAARVNDISVVPFAQLDGRAGCTTITTQPFPRQECIAVGNVTTTRKRVRITITPANTSIDPVVSEFERTQPPALNPFNFKL